MIDAPVALVSAGLSLWASLCVARGDSGRGLRNALRSGGTSSVLGRVGRIPMLHAMSSFDFKNTPVGCDRNENFRFRKFFRAYSLSTGVFFA